jgi:ribosomal protein S18 acetylase RimI-like enzyme
VRRIEETSLNAWPALQQTLYDGWLLRFSGGYTKRANSVNPLYRSELELGPKVRYAQDCYGKRGLPTIFRLTPFSLPEGLDAYLEQCGYRLLDPTQVMVLELAGARLSRELDAPSRGHLCQVAVDEWLTLYAELHDELPEHRAIHRAILGSIAGETRPYVLRDATACLACALGVREQDRLGLFDVCVAPSSRNQGWGTCLIDSILRRAEEDGVRWAYLQVTEANRAASGLYRKVGFEELYSYWYRIQGASPSATGGPVAWAAPIVQGAEF